jgi:hypothetical protein
MNLLWIIVFTIAFFIIVYLGFKFLYSADFPQVVKFLIIFPSTLFIYWTIFNAIYYATIKYLYIENKNKNMIIWDNIWYALVITLVAMFCAIFIKTVKNSNLDTNTLFNTLVLGFVLLVYTAMYYLYLFDNQIYEILKWTSIVFAILSLIVIISYFLPELITENIYISVLLSFIYFLYGILLIFLLICLFIVIFKLFNENYEKIRKFLYI